MYGFRLLPRGYHRGINLYNLFGATDIEGEENFLEVVLSAAHGNNKKEIKQKSHKKEQMPL